MRGYVVYIGILILLLSIVRISYECETLERRKREKDVSLILSRRQMYKSSDKQIIENYRFVGHCLLSSVFEMKMGMLDLDLHDKSKGRTTQMWENL